MLLLTKEVSALKLRIKYEKTGVLRYIGHLDIMRYFQKAIKRAKLDVSYTKGFSPHQIISFAAPMPLGMTSSGEYFDGEFNSVTTAEDMIKRFNNTMADGVKVLDITMLPETAKPSMAIVSASDYFIYKNDECEADTTATLIDYIEKLMSEDSIQIIKKTKSKEELSDIKPYIYDIKEYEYDICDDDCDNMPHKKGIYMLLASGSKMNLKPELVVEALCSYAGVEFNRYDYRIHRIETYMGERDELKPLSEAGDKF